MLLQGGLGLEVNTRGPGTQTIPRSSTGTGIGAIIRYANPGPGLTKRTPRACGAVAVAARASPPRRACARNSSPGRVAPHESVTLGRFLTGGPLASSDQLRAPPAR